MLCQTLNAEFSSKNIHVAHIIIDGAVDAPDTLGKMLGPESYQALRESRGMELFHAVADGSAGNLLPATLMRLRPASGA